MTVEGGAITSCEVVESSETETIGELALPVYCEEIVETQDPNTIDIASGASNTLRGFQVKVSPSDDEILKSVWIEPEQFQPWMPAPSDKTEDVFDYGA